MSFVFILFWNFRKDVIELRHKLEQEREAHSALEEHFISLQRDKGLIDAELRQAIQRHEQEYKAMNATITAVNL